MKVKFSKDYNIWESMLESDLRRLHEHRSVTIPCEYHKWEDADVTFDELKEMINKGYAILINC